MESVFAEEVPLDAKVNCFGGVENWLGLLLNSMKMTISNLIGMTQGFLETRNFDIIYAYPTMIGQVSSLGTIPLSNVARGECEGTLFDLIQDALVQVARCTRTLSHTIVPLGKDQPDILRQVRHTFMPNSSNINYPGS